MTTQTLTPVASASKVRAAIILIAATLIAIGLNAVIASVAHALGVSSAYGPLTVPAYASMTVLGVVAGWAGWVLIRRRARNPRRALTIIVPIVVVASFVPDVLLAVLRFVPGTTSGAVLALALMHIVVAGLAIPAYALASRGTPARRS
ncbi:DUF6069 family protein [Leifsonia sp. 1010]|uniref:DUF6069 family protein n=1 Tax=Leifsonia sp. 1010 TaxID=2817769 RepID=UPI002861A8E1|nr:DUF6069 family protein [Leifsonia sp. 1010]MDR6611246.1 heme/copper-type cytochrome/quinol oxidase subunit 2 [Leifsonia sp. 1010]